MRTHAYLLKAGDIPEKWYNVAADLPEPLAPPLDPRTQRPLADPAPLCGCFRQHWWRKSQHRAVYSDSGAGAGGVWALPAYAAFAGAAAGSGLDTPAHIYYKYEGVSPAGSHKPNAAIAQAYYSAKRAAVLVTETGAGQWGSALSMACRLMGLETRVYMWRVSYEQKPSGARHAEAYGAQVYPSPSNRTPFGREFAGTDHPGSLGIAITEAIQDVLSDEKAKYALGSVLNHVLLHQTVIGEEAFLQMQMAGEAHHPGRGCRRGSNFAGLTFPFIGRMLRECPACGS